MKSAWKIFWGVAFVLIAVFLILDAVGVITPFMSAVGEISIGAILVGLVFLAILISRLAKGKIWQIFFPLAFLFIIFEDNIAHLCYGKERNIINNWLVFLAALLLTVGFSILFSKTRKQKKHFSYGTINNSGKNVDNAFSSATVYVDSDTFSKRFVENSFGSCIVHFTNPECYKGDGTLIIDNSFGSVVVNVPADWSVVTDIENSFGGVSVPKHKDPGGPVLYIKGESSFGSINIKYI